MLKIAIMLTWWSPRGFARRTALSRWVMKFLAATESSITMIQIAIELSFRTFTFFALGVLHIDSGLRKLFFFSFGV